MTALARPRPVTRMFGDAARYQCAAVNIIQGAILGLNSSGFARGFTLGDRFCGHALESMDNQSGSAGDRRVLSLAGQYTLRIYGLSGVAITDAIRQAPVYAQDSGTLSLRSGQMVGRVVFYDPDEDCCWVEFNSTSSEQIYAETVLKSAFTDGGSTSGYLDLAVPIPAGARVLDWQADVRVALSGDTSAVLQVGESGNVDRFSSLTTSSVFVTGVVGSTAPTVSGDPGYCVAAVTPRLTVTSNSDFTNVNTLGQLDVKIRYSSSFRT